MFIFVNCAWLHSHKLLLNIFRTMFLQFHSIPSLCQCKDLVVTLGLYGMILLPSEGKNVFMQARKLKLLQKSKKNILDLGEELSILLAATNVDLEKLNLSIKHHSFSKGKSLVVF